MFHDSVFLMESASRFDNWSLQMLVKLEKSFG